MENMPGYSRDDAACLDIRKRGCIVSADAQRALESMIRKLRRELDLEYSKSRDALKALLIEMESGPQDQTLTFTEDAALELKENLRRVLESGS